MYAKSPHLTISASITQYKLAKAKHFQHKFVFMLFFLSYNILINISNAAPLRPIEQ